MAEESRDIITAEGRTLEDLVTDLKEELKSTRVRFGDASITFIYSAQARGLSMQPIAGSVFNQQSEIARFVAMLPVGSATPPGAAAPDGTTWTFTESIVAQFTSPTLGGVRSLLGKTDFVGNDASLGVKYTDFNLIPFQVNEGNSAQLGILITTNKWLARPNPAA